MGNVTGGRGLRSGMMLTQLLGKYECGHVVVCADELLLQQRGFFSLRGFSPAPRCCVMSARKRPKQTGSDAEAPPVPSGSAKAPLRLPTGTRVAFSRRTSDGAEAMACFQVVVVNDGGDRVDTPSVEQLQLRFALTDGGDDAVWWQNTCEQQQQQQQQQAATPTTQKA